MLLGFLVRFGKGGSMTSAEFKAAFQLAKSGEDLSRFSMDSFDGFGLPDFKPVTVQTGDVARLIRWQAGCFDGSWDMEAAGAVRECGRKRFLIVG